MLLGWRPLMKAIAIEMELLGWRPWLLGWRPLLLEWRPLMKAIAIETELLGWRPWLLGWRPLLVGWWPREYTQCMGEKHPDADSCPFVGSRLDGRIPTPRRWNWLIEPATLPVTFHQKNNGKV